jgi:phosphotransferase system enzyme I (PtsI)
MFRQQLRAILRAAAHGPVRLLIPMLAQAREVRLTLRALEQARTETALQGHVAGPVELGAMIEVPAAAIHLEALLPHFDFVSLGTNDLVQYTLAIDRADESVAHLYDPWHPAVLHLIERTIRLGREASVDVSVCGEMAGDVAFTDLLLAMGLRSFSMQPAQIAAVKQRILRVDARRASADLPDVREALDPAAQARRLWG